MTSMSISMEDSGATGDKSVTNVHSFPKSSSKSTSGSHPYMVPPSSKSWKKSNELAAGMIP